MKKHLLKRCLAWVMTVLMIVNCVPYNAFAETVHDHSTESTVTEEHVHDENCELDHSAEGEVETVTEGTDETATEGSDETATEGSDETVTEGSDETVTEGSDETATEGSDETVTEGSDETATEGSDETATEGSDETVTEETETDSSTEEEPEQQVSEAVADLQQQMAEIVERFGITSEMTDNDIYLAIAAKDGDTIETTYYQVKAMEEAAAAMSETEFYEVMNHSSYETFVNFNSVFEAMMTAMPLTTVSVLDGKVTVTDSANSNTVSNGVVTIKAAGSLFGKKTNNITIANDSGSKANVSFDYAVSSANSFTIAGATANASGSYSAILEDGATIAITLISNSGFSNTTATLTLSNFSCIEAKDSSDVTFNYDNSSGSVTAGGNAVANGETVNIPLTGTALVATAKSGATFLGWVNAETGSVLSTAASYTITPASDMTVKAAFAKNGGTPWFGVGSATQKSESTGLFEMSKIYYYQAGVNYLFDDLNAAASEAGSNGTCKYVVLMNSATLQKGTYTIPSGVKFLIPFDAANSYMAAEPLRVGEYKEPTAFRTLTLAAGANIVINGEMSVSAKHKYAQGSKLDGAAPTGNVGWVTMSDGSSITVNNGGTLYAYGFITGSGNRETSGTVTVKSGGRVYEMFQIADFRGGSATTDMINSKYVSYGVFPLSQYYVQNIEVPLTM